MWRAGQLLRTAKAVVVTVPPAILVHDVVGKVAEIRGASMQPTLNPIPYEKNDWVAVRKFFYSPKRGDVVIARNPSDPSEYIVKRILGLPGDMVKVQQQPNSSSPYSYNTQVPRGHCWLEGDNFGRSNDSNSFGPAPLALIQGKVSFIFWPPTRFGFVHSVEPGTERVPYKSNMIDTQSTSWLSWLF
ncbi:hypothetical protein AAMO2058_001219400 [Amorphochlora amoebiformis]|uniref:Mitochondrial inner membrane protease subunit n=1 Tax=Amorphochlora amoebiformis TaxID=1561963 RepID=A0A7S0DL37_9EUKA|mmetsp:Transcript_32874/g.52887  ORF Transcript_32874/g.52887 Transcript_32874/m.52887 type:complete len:187 (+) Transcript_32874:24-584(+)